MNMNTRRSEVMTRANQLRKEQNLNKSEALKTAWAEIKNKYPSKEVKTIELKSIDDMTTLEKIQEYKKLQDFVESIQEQMEQIKQTLIDEMEQQQTSELKIDIFKVRYITVISNRFNTTEFKKTHEDLYNQYLKESKSKRFTIAC